MELERDEIGPQMMTPEACQRDVPFSWHTINRASHRARRKRCRYFVMTYDDGVIGYHRMIDCALATFESSSQWAYLFRVTEAGPVKIEEGPT